MTDIYKYVSNAIPSYARTQNFSNDVASGGDVLMIRDSLGRAATNATIECTGGDMQVRFNVYHTAYPRIPAREGMMNVDHLPYLVSGVRYKDSSMGTVDIEAGSTYAWERDFLIDDIELVVVSGNFDIFVS